MSSRVATKESGSTFDADGARRVSTPRIEHLAGAEKIFAQAGNQVTWPMGTFDWMAACSEAFGRGRAVELVTAYRGREAVAVAPMVITPVRGVDHAMVLGVAELIEPTDLIYRDDAALELLATELLARGRPVGLERVFADSRAPAVLARASAGKAAVVERPMGACPYIALDGSWSEPEGHLNSGRRSDLRRARRHAEEKGAVAVEIRSPEVPEVDALLDEAFEVEARSWKGDEGTAVKLDPRRSVFYRDYAKRCARAGMLRLCFLRIGGQAVGMQYAVEMGGRFSLLKIGYDAAYAKCSPGMLLMRETIRYAAEKGLGSYEFLGTAASWTQVWTKEQRACVSVHVYPYGVRGLAALAGKAATSVLAKVRGKGAAT